MKKFFNLILFMSLLPTVLSAQSGNGFNSVPLVNSKVIFQQYIISNDGASEPNLYETLSKWGKNRYMGKPGLLGFILTDKAKSLTVSSTTELKLPDNKVCVMSYKFDATIKNPGCVLVIRSIAYVNPDLGDNSQIQKNCTAEELIIDSAVSAGTNKDKEYKENVKNLTLSFFNDLYDSLNKALTGH